MVKDVNELIFDGKTDYYLFDFDRSSVIGAFSDKRINMSLNSDDKDVVRKNRNNFCKSLGINYTELVCLEQVHDNNIVEVGSNDKGRGAIDFSDAIKKSDGAITNEAGVPICILTADCIPLIFYVRKNGVVGIVHAGWKGVLKEISKKMINLMKNKYKVSPSDILVGVGPSMRSCCYEVNDDFKEYFSEYLIYKKGRIYFDLIKANQDQLVSSGIKITNIIDSGFCTSCLNDRFFSYRKEKGTVSRMMSIVMLK